MADRIRASEVTMATQQSSKPNYGVDAPGVLRNLFLVGGGALLLSFFVPHTVHLGAVVDFRSSLRWTGGWFVFSSALFLLYVKYGKFQHRDFMLSLYNWRGNEQVLDVGCGRGLLLAGAAKHLTTGHATGLDIWSNVDMGGNSEAATLHNLQLEGVSQRCSLVSEDAQQMPFPDDSFDVVVSNLCLHNIYDRSARLRALHQIVRVLKPGGIALISDYKLTGEYAAEFTDAGLIVQRRWGSILTTFPPLRVVIARKPV
ncbi:methyltransferase domain-containing protein [Granulicella sp. 5B5]|uniref:class I SAM-dependent methyltransferase n=1 Tax=Granulicella sp. 5B5 TaxID=1617967 RepID=UPI0015F51D19|nr:class I SAM-dependent methyltransferase [Granulicella sp. 5B5]QMV19855.1 methyltransferase domain-containing protein [Granulicella sp. 5B5]